MTFTAVINSNPRATPAGEARAAAGSTLALAASAWDALSPLLLQCSEWTHCECHPSCGSGELPGNLREISPKPSSVEKGMKAGTHGDLCQPPLGRDFPANLGRCGIVSLARAESHHPRSSASGGLVLERPGLHVGRGYPGLPSVSDRQPQSLSFSWKVSN